MQGTEAEGLSFQDHPRMYSKALFQNKTETTPLPSEIDTSLSFFLYSDLVVL